MSEPDDVSGPDDVSDPDDAGLVWYAAYGSNMYAARLRYYLAGGTPPGGRLGYPGCRDTRAPRRTMPVMLPGGIYFALESRAWTGGIALYDPNLPGRAAARAYLITSGQFADVLAQEMHRPPGVDPALLADVSRHGRVELGPGRYETVVCAGTRDGHPVLTFTARWSASDVACTAPAPAYLAMLAGGLHESHGWDPEHISAYLAGRPGVLGRWPRRRLDALVAHAVAPRPSPGRPRTHP